MGAVVNNLTPQSSTEPMGQMRRIEQVESGTSERVEDVFSLLEADETKSEEPKQLTLEEQFKQNIKHHNPSAQPSPGLAIGQ
jgi:hypothetical protein